MKEKKMIIVNGPSCVGKSTIIDLLFKVKVDIFWLKYDAIKRLFIDYSYPKDFDKIMKLLTLIGKDRIDNEDDILIEGPLYRFAFENIFEYAKHKGYIFYEFNLEAPVEVLIKRFENRVRLPINGIKINTSIDRYLEIIDSYEKFKNKDAKTFNTSIMSAKAISDDMLAILVKESF